MIVLMAGLPASGKSTLCRELALRTGGAILDKDEIRAALFVPDHIEYSTGQDDFCMKVMLETAAFILENNPQRVVFLDGRPFSRRYQVDQVIAASVELKQAWRILQCVCSNETARKRLDEQAGVHPAGNRNYQMYSRIKDGFEEITLPKTVIDTEQPLESCVALARAALE
jgi:predicted kinase